MQSSFDRPINLKNCPICKGLPRLSGNKEDCRIQEKTGMIHCRSILNLADSEKTNICPPTWEFKKISKIGFAIFVKNENQKEYYRFFPDYKYTQFKGFKPESNKNNNNKQNLAIIQNLINSIYSNNEILPEEDLKHIYKCQGEKRIPFTNELKQKYLEEVEERNRKCQLLLNQLTLKSEHEKELLERGFTKEEIVNSQYKSIEKNQKINQDIWHKIKGLPGIDIDKPYFSNKKYGGIICPIKTVDNKIIGWQLNTDKKDREEYKQNNKNLGKYLWAVSYDKNTKYGSQLDSLKELPLHYCYPKQGIRLPNTIFLSEGVSHKINITANKLGVPCIGASGANFLSCFNQLIYYIETSISTLFKGVKKEDVNLILCPDAESIQNPLVCLSYSKLIEGLRYQGYDISLLWWNQYKKSDCDIDELIVKHDIKSISCLTSVDYLVNETRYDTPSFELISWELFINDHIENYSQPDVSQKELDKPNLFKISQSNVLKTDLSINANKGYDQSQYQNINEPDAIEYEAYIKEKEEQERIEELQKKQWAEDKRKVYNKKQWLSYYDYDKNSQRYPQIKYKEINSQYVNDGIKTLEQKIKEEIVKENTVIFVKSKLGSGKTQWISEQLNQLKEEGMGCYCITYRNTLAVQLGSRLKLKHLHYQKVFDEISNQTSQLVFCIDSLTHFNIDDFEGKIIVIDELVSVINHLLCSSTLKNKRELIIKKFREGLRKASIIICLDGNLNNFVCDFLLDSINQGISDDMILSAYINNNGKKLVNIKQQKETKNKWINEKTIYKINNTYKDLNKIKCAIITGSINEESKINKNDKSGLINNILNQDRSVVISDSQIILETIDNILTAEGKSVLRIDSKTIPDLKEDLEDIDNLLLKRNVDYLLYSPSCESGVSIDIHDYFKGGFAIFTGVVNTDTQIQMLRRVRDKNIFWQIFCPEYSTMNDHTDSLRELTISNTERMLEEFNMAYSSNFNPLLLIQSLMLSFEVEINYGFALLWKNKYEKSNYKECLVHQLKQNDFEIISEFALIKNKETLELYKGTKNELLDRNSLDIYNAEDIEENQAKDISVKFSSRWEDRCKADKYWIKSILPTIEKSDIWTPELIRKIKYDQRNLISSLQTFYYLMNEELLLIKAQKLWEKRINEGYLFDIDYNSQLLVIQSIKEMEIISFLEDYKGELLDQNDSRLKSIIEKGKEKQHERRLKLKVGKQKPLGYLNKVLNKIGFEVKNTKKKRDGKDIYAGTVQLINKDQSIHETKTLLNCIHRYWKKWLSKNKDIDIVSLNKQLNGNTENSSIQLAIKETKNNLVNLEFFGLSNIKLINDHSIDNNIPDQSNSISPITTLLRSNTAIEEENKVGMTTDKGEICLNNIYKQEKVSPAMQKMPTEVNLIDTDDKTMAKEDTMVTDSKKRDSIEIRENQSQYKDEDVYFKVRKLEEIEEEVSIYLMSWYQMVSQYEYYSLVKYRDGRGINSVYICKAKDTDFLCVVPLKWLHCLVEEDIQITEYQANAG